MRRDFMPARVKRVAVAAFATVAVAASAALVLPASAMAEDNSVGSITYYLSKDTIPHPYVKPLTSTKSLLDTALSYAADSKYYKVIVTLNEDLNTRSYGKIQIPKGSNVEFRLQGHMIDRDFAESSYSGTGSGEVFRILSNATLTVDGGTQKLYHKGKLCNGGKFWESTSDGNYLISGGLVAGGANDSNEMGGGFSVYGSGAKLCLKNVTVAGNVADKLLGVHGQGGGIYLHGEDSSLELDNAKVVYNHAELAGGGIYVDGKNTTIVAKDSSVSSNSSVYSGGGISHNGKGGTVTLTNTAVNYNDVQGSAAGIYDCADGTTFTLNNSTVSYNANSGNYIWSSADMRGRCGGVHLDAAGTLNLTNGSKISNNTAREGAGVWLDGEDALLTMDGASAIENNTASEDGGGVGFDEDCQNIVMKGGSKICGNKAGGNGGGLYMFGGYSLFGTENIRIQMEGGSSICDNTAAGQGGGIYTKFGDHVSVFSDGTGSIAGNSAKEGGGVYRERGRLFFTNISISRNSATQSYGGVRVGAKDECVLMGKIVIAENYAKQSSSNYCAPSIRLDDSSLLTADSRIGLDINGSGYSRHGETWVVFESKAQLDKLGTAYLNVFFSDDVNHKVTRDGDALKLVEGTSNIVLSIYGNTDTPEYRAESAGTTVRLNDADYAKPGYVIDYWDVTGLGSGQKVYSENGTATFELGSTHCTARAHYAPVLTGLELTLKDSSNWGILGANFNTVELSSLRLLAADGISYGVFINNAIRNATSVAASAQTNGDGSKTVNYTVTLNKAVLDNYGLSLDEAQLDAVTASLRTGFAQVDLVKTAVSKGEDGSLMLSMSGTVAAPGEETVTVSAVNANKYTDAAFDSVVEQVSTLVNANTSGDSSSGVKGDGETAGVNGTVTVEVPDEPGWKFVGWKKLPDGAVVDNKTNAVIVGANVVSGFTLEASFKPLVSAIAITVPDLVPGEAFPSAIESCLVAGASERDLTEYVKDSIKVTWTKADGSDAGDEVEGNTVYKATLATSGKGSSYLFGFDSSVRVTVNDSDADVAKLDASGSEQIISYYTTSKEDTRYDRVAVNYLPSLVYEASDIDDSLPTSACYLLKNGELKTAPVTWDKSTVDEGQTSGSFTVEGSFEDVYGDSHEITQDLTIIDLGAPEASWSPKNDGTGVQAITLGKGDGWQGSDGYVKYTMYYAVVNANEAADYDALGNKKYYEYTGPVEIGPGEVLATYAEVQLENSVKKTEIGVYGRSLETAKVTTSKAAYNADEPQCNVTVKLDGITLTEGEDYMLMYSADYGVGKANAIVIPLIAFDGYKEFKVTVVPAKVTGVKAKAKGKKKVVLSWSKHKAQTDGFQVRYAASKAKLAKNEGKAAKVKNAGAKSYTAKKLKSGKKYFFKVRAYKVVDGKTYWSAWSKVKAAKAK